MAGQIAINPESVRRVAQQFHGASSESDGMVRNLNNQINGLQAEWKGLANQSFYNDFQNWSKQMTNYVQLLENIGKELDRITQEFIATDQALSRRSS